jgi:hypothetical protein
MNDTDELVTYRFTLTPYFCDNLETYREVYDISAKEWFKVMGVSGFKYFKMKKENDFSSLTMAQLRALFNFVMLRHSMIQVQMSHLVK